MSRWNLKKITAFLLAIILLAGTSFDGSLGMGIRTWADPLSPENAVTFNIPDIGSPRVFSIDGNYYFSNDSRSANPRNLYLYKLDITNKKATLVCNVSTLIPGATSLVHYRKVGSNHCFIVCKGDFDNEYAYFYTIYSSDLINFSATNWWDRGSMDSYPDPIVAHDVGTTTFLTYITKGGPTDDKWADIARLKSTDLINWTTQFNDGEGDGRQAGWYFSNPVDIIGNSTIVGYTNFYYSHSDGYRDRTVFYDHYKFDGTRLIRVNINNDCYSYERESKNEPTKWLNSDQRYRHVLENFGTFTFVFRDKLGFISSDWEPSLYVTNRPVKLYYGSTEGSFGSGSQQYPNYTWTYNDGGVYSQKVGAIDKYFYYLDSSSLPASFVLKRIDGTTMTSTTLKSVSNYSNAYSKYEVNGSIYLKLTVASGYEYYKITNGSISAITASTYEADMKQLPLEPPDAEYRALNYYRTYADKDLAIYYNSTESSVKVIRNNTIPAVTVAAPSHNSIFGLQHTAVIPQISVSDPDNNALTCKYYLDGAEKETKTIAGNTSTPQAVSYKALNMSTLPEGAHTMKFTVTDNFLTAEATVSFRVDKTPPGISSLTATSTESGITVSASASDAVAGLGDSTYPPYNYTITDGTNTWQSGWKTQTTHTQGSLQPNRNYTVKLEARDKAGNTAQKSITRYTKAQKPSVTTGNTAATAMDIIIGGSNPSNTQYQIAMGTRYISSTGALAAAPQWITLTNKRIRAAGLTPNTTYAITAKARNGANEETPSSAAVNAATLPNAPEGITAQPGRYSIILTWPAMPNIIRYEVSADGQVESNGTSTIYTHDDLTPNTQHTYKVRAVNTAGAGAWSNTLTAATLPDPPGVPMNFRAEASQNAITLLWDAAGGAASYDIEADGSLKESITGTTYTHSGLLPDTPHTYRIRAVNRGGTGAWSDLLNADTLPEPPGIPEGLQITERTQNSVTLSWNTAERAEVYDIEADGAIIDSTAETFYTHTGLAADTEHSYRIKARNRGGESQWTAEAMIRTLPEIPSTPNNLTATAGTNEITLSWDAAERAEEYDIEADGTIIAAITGTSYTHNGLTPDTMHTYRVKARNIGGESDYSTMITAYTLSETTVMALTNVAAVVTNTSITLMWDAVAADTEYEVEVDGEIKDNGKITTYIHGGLQPVTSHTYKIRPKKGEEKGPWCAVLAISTLPNAPGAPDNIRAIVTNTAIQLMWDAEEGATGYDIEIDGNHVESTADTVFTHKDLIPGTEHSYRIRATNIGGAAAWSEAIVKSTIKPTYMIEAEAGEEYHIALTAMGMQEFSGRKLVLEYDPGEAEIIDLCEETRDIELESGKIPGTDITISHGEGRIELEADKRLEPGKAWTGVINTILIRSRIDGMISLDYLVE